MDEAAAFERIMTVLEESVALLLRLFAEYPWNECVEKHDAWYEGVNVRMRADECWARSYHNQ